MTNVAAEGEATGFAIHPMDQFIVKRFFCDPAHADCTSNIQWFEITNVTVWMAAAVAVIALLMIMGSRGRALIRSGEVKPAARARRHRPDIRVR